MSGDVEGRMMIYEMLKLQPIPKYNFEFQKQYFIKILHRIKSGPKMDLFGDVSYNNRSILGPLCSTFAENEFPVSLWLRTILNILDQS